MLAIAWPTHRGKPRFRASGARGGPLARRRSLFRRLAVDLNLMMFIVNDAITGTGAAIAIIATEHRPFRDALEATIRRLAGRRVRP
jgi:hypothetical protein